MTVPRDQGADEPTPERPRTPEPSKSPEPPRTRSRDVRLVVTGILLALGVWFAVANTTEVRIHFWLASTRTPVVVALVIAALIGVAVGLLLGRRFRRPPS